jgi:hypothetical protein
MDRKPAGLAKCWPMRESLMSADEKMPSTKQTMLVVKEKMLSIMESRLFDLKKILSGG